MWARPSPQMTRPSTHTRSLSNRLREARRCRPRRPLAAAEAVAVAAPAEAEALPPAQSGSATSMRGSSTRSLRACTPGAVAVVAVAPDRGGDARIPFGTTVTGSLVKSASDMTPMCCVSECHCQWERPLSIGFYYVVTQKDPTQMFTAIARHSPSTPLAHLTMPPQSAVLAQTGLLTCVRPGHGAHRALSCCCGLDLPLTPLAIADRTLQSIAINVIELAGPPVDCDCGSYAAASAPQTCEPAVPRAVRG